MSNVESFPTALPGLSEYEALLAAAPSVLDAVPGAVYICDHEGWVVRYNAEAAEAWGRAPAPDGPRDLFCGSHRLFLPDGTLLLHEECPMADAVRAGTVTRNAEVMIERPDGSRIWALVNIRPLRGPRGEIQGAINCFQDISARKRIEDELHRSAEDLEDFFENAAIGLHIVSRDGIIQRANKAELDLLGYLAEEYVGRPIAEFHADAEVIGDILKRLTSGQDLVRYPARLRAKDGTIKHVLITSNGRFEGNRFKNTRCFTTDVTAIYEAESARHESDERLAATYEAATVGITEVGADGNILRANDAICQILGRTREELLTMNFLDYTGQEDQEQDAVCYAKQVAGEINGYSIRKRAIRPDGKYIYLDVHSSSVRDREGNFRYGVRVIQDVTEAKINEDRLRASEQQMRDLLEALPAAVYTTDADGVITFYNKAAVEMAGRTPQPGEKWCVTWRLYNIDGTPLPHEECPMAVALKEGRRIRGVEAIAERPDGTRIPFIPYPTPLRDADGKLIGAINMLVDISERKKAEEYAQLLALIVEFSDDAILSKDIQGIIQSWNKGAEQLYGYEASEAIGQPITMLLAPDRPDEETIILDKIRRGEHVSHYETVRMRKDGTLVDVSLTVSPLKNAWGHIVGASGISRDITERRRQEERRQLLINELNHRVKNTLATVQSLAAQTFRGDNRSSAYHRFESRLIALSRAHDVLTREHWGDVELRELVEEAVTPMCADPLSRISMSGPQVRLRPKIALSLSLAFHELATNAAKYGALCNDAGRVNIRWEIPSLHGEPRLQLHWSEEGGPPVKEPQEKGFGTRLLEQALVRELGAQVELSFLTSGVVCDIQIAIK
ncbi:PAS domain S-box protein [Brucella endophytica]|nr:PAS domain S-box protein [Brucella endophytica]